MIHGEELDFLDDDIVVQEIPGLSIGGGGIPGMRSAELGGEADGIAMRDATLARRAHFRKLRVRAKTRAARAKAKRLRGEARAMIPTQPRNFIEGGRPNDQRRFIHKKILGVATKALGVLPIPGANIIQTGLRFFGGSGSRPSLRTFPEIALPGLPNVGSSLRLNGGTGNGAQPCQVCSCPPPLIYDPQRDICLSAKSGEGRDTFSGTAVVGRFGPAIVAESELREVSVCPTGMALGKDGLCYDHLPNRDRKYPRGRRPLLTGGEMKCISRAASAGRKLARTRSDLTAIGMLKAPVRRKRKKY